MSNKFISVLERSKHKEIARNKLSDTVTNLFNYYSFPTNINSLSLAAQHWLFEKTLAAQNPERVFNYTSLENDPDIFKEQIRTAIVLNNKYKNATYIPYSRIYPIDIKTYLMFKRNLEMDLIYLDFMGNWSPEKENYLERIFVTNTNKEQYILAFTTSIIRTHNNNQEKLLDYAFDIDRDLYSSVNQLGLRLENPTSRDLYFYGVNGFINQLAKKHNKEVKIHTPIEYINKNGNLQIVFLYRILN